MNVITKTVSLPDGRTITIETGKVAKQADGSVVLRMNNTVLLATVCAAKDAVPGTDFMPLQVDYREQYAAAGYEIIGVSKDKQALQKKFADAHGLQFPLIADTDTTLLQALGCWGEKATCGRKTIGILRTTYLVNEEGVIEKIFTPKEIKTKIHAEQILNAIKA